MPAVAVVGLALEGYVAPGFRLAISSLALACVAIAAVARPLQFGALALVLHPIADVHASAHVAVVGKDVKPDVLWGAVFALTVGALAWRYRGRRWDMTLVVTTGLVSAVGVVGAALGPAPKESLREWAWVVLVLAMLVVATHLPSEVEIAAPAVVVATAGAITCLLVALHPHGNVYSLRLVHGFASVSELTGGYPTANELAIPCVGLAAWALVLALTSNQWLRLAGAIVSIGLAVVIVLTTIRTAQIGLAILVVGAVAVAAGRVPHLAGRRIRIAAAAGTVLVGALLLAIDANIRNRWLEIFTSGNQRGLQWAGSGRGYLWHQALNDFQYNGVAAKIFGSGFYSDIQIMRERTGGSGFAAHNDVLEILVSLGIVGLVLSLVLIGLVVIRIVRARRATALGERWVGTFALYAAAAFAAVAVLTGFVRYTSAAVPGLLLIGYAAGYTGRAAGAACETKRDGSALNSAIAAS